MSQALSVALTLTAQAGFPVGTVHSGYKATFTDPKGGVLEGVTTDLTGATPINILIPASGIEVIYTAGTAYAIDQFGTPIGTPVQIHPTSITVPAGIVPTTVTVSVVSGASAAIGAV